MKISDFRCACCRGTDSFYINCRQRHFVRCQGCGLVRILLVRPIPPRPVLTNPPDGDACEKLVQRDI